MTFKEKAIKHARIKIPALLKTAIGLAVFIFAEYVVLTAFYYFNVDRKIYKGTYNFIVCLLTIAAMFIFHKLNSKKNDPLIKIGKLMPTQVAALVIIAMGMLGFVTVYIILADKIAAYLESLKEVMQEYRETVDRFSDTPQVKVPFWDSILYVASICFCVPVAEEMAFRGVLYGSLRKGFGPWTSVILSACIFGVLHGLSVHVGYAFVCGLVIAACYHLTNTLIAPILLHMVFNILGSGIANLLQLEQFGFPKENLSKLMTDVNVVSILMMPVSVFAFAYLVSVNRKKNAQKAIDESGAAV